eukprot:CAMPEP_0194441772 /NCGR_PEP_ID=MMETSP0176-20130528/123371_1 /TAXON_ID=216777 /ORGANISM="Proboscia alata, Strain PI-D3" /LENGTH=62 /DNA_ID=CAMNT_0039267413 /DNA_START=632 /DNA_END=817 /DNA_ORIENTATION=-
MYTKGKPIMEGMKAHQKNIVLRTLYSTGRHADPPNALAWCGSKSMRVQLATKAAYAYTTAAW